MNASRSACGVDAVQAAVTVPLPLVRRAALTLRAAIEGLARRRRRQRLARATLLTLQSLDARTLRDIGFDRSEIPSAASEVLGVVEVTRARIVRSL